jgi:hypothetical protein
VLGTTRAWIEMQTQSSGSPEGDAVLR